MSRHLGVENLLHWGLLAWIWFSCAKWIKKFTPWMITHWIICYLVFPRKVSSVISQQDQTETSVKAKQKKLKRTFSKSDK